MEIGELSKPGRASKPNEDAYWIVRGEGFLGVAVMDGCPVPENGSGYPEANGSIAARVAAETIAELARKERSVQAMRDAFRVANQKIKEENQTRGLYGKPGPHWISTVGCALWIDLVRRVGYVGYIGDTPLFLRVPRGELTLITVDQMWLYHEHMKGHGLTSSNAEPGLREYRDRVFRNRKSGPCSKCSTSVAGYGELNGEPMAMQHVKVSSHAIFPDMEFLLASDAIRVLGLREGHWENYEKAFRLLRFRRRDPQTFVNRLYTLTRAYERDCKRPRHDDATFVHVRLSRKSFR